MKKLKVLIVDDQNLFTDSLRTVLVGQDGTIGHVSTAHNGEEAIDLVRDIVPDIVLMDIHMPVMDGIETTKRIHKEHPEVKILMLTTFGYDDYVREALDSGAVGFLLKDISSEELISSIVGARSGLRIVSPEIISGANPSRTQTTEPKAIPEWFRQMTQREREILILVQKGFSNEEIAEQIFLSIHTVKNYLSSIYDKMDVKNRFKAMRLAMEHKVDSLPGGP